MANQADVYLRNHLLSGNLEVSKGSDIVTLSIMESERIPLLSTEESLTIKAPENKNIKYCPLEVQSDVDLSIKVMRTDSTWTIQILPNDLPPDVGTTIKVTVSEEEP